MTDSAEPQAIVKEPARFMALLEQSGILRPGQLQTARRIADESSSSRLVARRLVAKGILTRWQAGQLLVGWSRLRLGNYKLCQQIGRGVFGRVFLAEHVSMEREVAIKTLSRRYTQRSQMVDRFLSEARQVAALDHRNLVHVLDIDSSDGQYFMVMEYVEGEDLQRRVEREGRLPIHAAVRYLGQAASGLEYAHRSGLVHRDVRPANLMVDNRDVTKLLGLGVGSLGDPQPKRGPSDEPAVPLGDYRSPEQRDGHAAVNHRSDIYSLGCTAGFLLTGRVPAGDVATRDFPHLYGEPFQDVGIPAPLADIVCKMMAADPQRRYGSAHEVQRVLERWSSEHPEPSTPVPPAKLTGGLSDANRLEIATGNGQRHPVITRSDASPRRKWYLGGAGVLATFILIACTYLSWPDTARPLAAKPGQGTARANDQPDRKRPVLKARQRSSQAVPPSDTLGERPQSDAQVAADRDDGDAPQEQQASAAALPNEPDEPEVPKPEPARNVVPAKKAADPPEEKQAPERPVMSENPLKGLPDAVDLPAADAVAGDAELLSFAGHGRQLAERLQLALLGGAHAAGRSGNISLQPVTGGDTPAWTAVLNHNNLPEDGQITIATLRVADGQLRFAWEGAAELPDDAQGLRNCVLRLTVQKHLHNLRLRTAERVEPLNVVLTRSALNQRWTLKSPPDPRQLRFEVTRLADPLPNVYNLKPVGPVTADESVLVLVGSKDVDGHVLELELLPEVRGAFRLQCRLFFWVTPQLERIPLTSKNFEQVTVAVAAKQQSQNLAAQAARAAISRMPRQDPTRRRAEQNLTLIEATLAQTSEATARMEVLHQLRKATAEGAALHFRLFYLADDCEVDLLRTED